MNANSVISMLTFIILWANSADDRLIIYLLFPLKIGFDTSCKLSPKETICMRCLILFSGENKKFFKMLSAEIFTQHAEHYILYLPKMFGKPILIVKFLFTSCFDVWTCFKEKANSIDPDQIAPGHRIFLISP